jgi:uncharacterized membrane protein
MAKTVVALYDDFNTAQKAVQDLRDNDFPGDDISLVANNAEGRYDQYVGAGRERSVAKDEDHVSRGEETGISAGAGALAGGVGGLLLGLGLFAVPGIGPALAAGPIAGTLAGAGLGAAAGGLSGWLFHAGMPEEEARSYEEGVRRGGTLIAVTTSDARAERATGILNQHHPVDMRQRSAEWQNSNPPINEVGVAPYQGETINREHEYYETHPENPGGQRGPAGSSGYNAYVPDFENHYTSNFGGCNYPFDAYQPGYRYGYDLANDSRYRDRNWSEVEPEARRQWEERNPATWSQFKDAIHYAWDKAHSKS